MGGQKTAIRSAYTAARDSTSGANPLPSACRPFVIDRSSSAFSMNSARAKKGNPTIKIAPSRNTNFTTGPPSLDTFPFRIPPVPPAPGKSQLLHEPAVELPQEAGPGGRELPGRRGVEALVEGEELPLEMEEGFLQ